MYRVALAALLLFSACATTDDADPSPDELADLDSWANTADGKADLPNTWGETVAWLRDVYTNRMSAIWNHQEHPATPAAAMSRIRQLALQSGISDPTTALYPARVQRLRTELLDHSEIDITLAPGKVIRLVGDPKGAGAFVDSALFKTSIGQPLCLTWSELQIAIETAYVPGDYAVDFVCHTITERVLRALHAGSATYADQVHTFAAARWIWGPQVPSFNSQNPASWPVSRSCPAR